MKYPLQVPNRRQTLGKLALYGFSTQIMGGNGSK